MKHLFFTEKEVKEGELVSVLCLKLLGYKEVPLPNRGEAGKIFYDEGVCSECAHYYNLGIVRNREIEKNLKATEL